MNDRKADLGAVSTFADHEVIVPPNKLKKAVQKLKVGEKLDFDPVARAEAALAELAAEFSVWMESECARLDGARNAIKASGITQGSRDVLFRAAHDIRGQAATFGYPLVAPVAESLCRLIEHTPDVSRLPLRLVDQHVDAVRAIFHKNTRGDVGKYAAELAEKLRHVTDEFLVRENHDRPDVLDSILSPSVVPNS
jgi:HPt (histidine-containing phosphotransfer) domain-containing protein